MNEELLVLTWKGAVNQELGQEGQRDKSHEGRGNKKQGWDCASSTIVCLRAEKCCQLLCFTAQNCVRTLTQTQTGVFIKSICLSECLHLDAFLLRFLKFSINTMVWVAKDRLKKEKELLCYRKQGWHCWAPWWCRVGIGFRAAQNHTESHYLQLKATLVSLIHTAHPHTSHHNPSSC